MKKRDLDDNLKLHSKEAEAEVLKTKIEELQKSLGDLKYETLLTEKRQLVREEDTLNREVIQLYKTWVGSWLAGHLNYYYALFYVIFESINIFQSFSIYCFVYFFAVGHDGVVGIAIHYGLDGLDLNPGWGRDFPHLS